MKKALYWVLPISIMAVIFFFSAEPSDLSTQTSQSLGTEILNILDFFFDFSLPTAAEIDTLLRKGAHFAIYAALGGSFYIAVRKTFSRSFGGLSLLFSLLYAISDELHQYFVPGRSAQVTDVLLDFSGSLTGVLFVFLLWRAITRKIKN